MTEPKPSALIVGASRGLGLGLVREYLARGWDVVATVRNDAGAATLRALAPGAGSLSVEHVDVCVPETVKALHARLAERRFDLLFLVAGVSEPRSTPHLIDLPVEEFQRVLTTNVYWPVLFVEQFHDLVTEAGTIVLMTSRLGSIASHDYTVVDTYCVSKAGLNMAVVCTAPRWHADRRTVLLMHPGWVRTEMGGEDAPLDVETSTRGMADTIAARTGTSGVHYVDYANAILPW